MISIGCPIFRSVAFCDFIYKSLHEHTPHLHDGRAELFFVANDATQEVLDHLVGAGYKHFVHTNTHRTDEENAARRIAKPDYLARVYRCLNRMMFEASGDTVIYVSSDMAFSPGWLDALLAEDDGNTLVTSQLVEPSPRINSAAGAILGDFGHHPSEFNKKAFEAVAREKRVQGTRLGGQYVPMLIPVELFHMNGGFPEGNVGTASEFGIAGDRVFVDRYVRLGARHITATNSVVYHFTEGEMREPSRDDS